MINTLIQSLGYEYKPLDAGRKERNLQIFVSVYMSGVGGARRDLIFSQKQKNQSLGKGQAK